MRSRNFAFVFIIFSLFLALSSCLIFPARKPAVEILSGFTAGKELNNTFGLLSWNIHKESGRLRFERDFMDIIDAYSPEFVLLQEFQTFSVISPALNENCGKGYIFARNFHYQGRELSSGLLICSDAAPDEYFAMLSEAKEPFAGTPKIALIVRYKIKNSADTLLLINIHCINFMPGTKEYEAQLESIAEIAKCHRGPLIWAGDFNSWSAEREKVLLTVTAELELSEVNFGWEEKRVKSFFEHRLDRIFYNRYLSVVSGSADVLEQYASSDHRALYCRFVINHGP